MPHVTFVPLTGFRIREPEMLELGMSLPGLRDRARAIAELPALGLLTLAGMTSDLWKSTYRGIEQCNDASIDLIRRDRPDLVAISALTASIEEAYTLCRRLREHGIPTVIGGLHATACPDEAEQYADAVVVGRGELVWRQVLDDALSNSLQHRYVAPFGESPKWPQPRFDLLGYQPSRLTLQTQTGCPLACGFCGASRLLGRFAEKPAELIRRELASIRQLNSRPLIELADDNTFAGSRCVDELFDVFEESNAKWFTEADWRIGEKQAEMDRIMKSVSTIQEAGVAVNGCFIIGADGETRQSLDAATEFILNSPFAEVQVTLQTPFPGTSLYRNLADEGRLLTERGWSAYSLFDVTYHPDQMSVAELEAGFRNVLTKVFSARASQRRNRIRRDIRKRARELASNQGL